MLSAMAIIAIRMMSLEKLLDPEAATFFAMKNSKFIFKLRVEDKVKLGKHIKTYKF